MEQISYYNTPLRLPNLPNLKTEALFNGGQIPAYWETFYHDPNQSNVDPKYFQGIKGTVSAGKPGIGTDDALEIRLWRRKRAEWYFLRIVFALCECLEFYAG